MLRDKKAALHGKSSAPPLVALRGVVKDFPGIRANDGVDFDLWAGEIHALLGENGAGKTTLMNILAGLYRPDGGEMMVRGEEVRFRSPRDAIERGVGMVHQHFRLVERFTVAENVTLGWHTPRGIIRRRPLEREIAALSESYHVRVHPERVVWQLSVGEQQRVEILKNVYRGASILILDEPTAVLAPQEAASLFASLRAMAEDGRGIVFISHKLDEVMQVADRITVLRRGRNVATVARADTSERELARLMMGRDQVPVRTDPGQPIEERILELSGVEADDDRGLRALRGIDLAIHAGEILGLAGVAGNGQRELAEAIVGLRPVRAGRILVRGADVTGWSVGRRIEAGVGYSPEDRVRDGVAPSLSVAENLTAKSYRTAPIGGRLFVRRRLARHRAAELIREFDIRGAELDAPASSLSGGNLQKLLLARELAAEPWVLVAAQPTRGLDLGAADAARRFLIGVREAGRAVLLISEDLDELLALSDRVAVIYSGRILGTFPASGADEERIGLLMAGAARAGATEGE
jgi:simple sugar transport system ATP-binding protein